MLTVLWHWQLLPRWLALSCFFAWVAKDLILYPFLRRAYEGGAKSGSVALVGTRGVVHGDLNPAGYVRVRGELWLAVALPADQVVASGTDMEVINNTEGMKIFVRAVENLGRR